MATVTDRVDALEGQMSGHSHAIAHLAQRTELGFGETVRKFDAVGLRLDIIDRRFEEVERRFDAVDRRFEAIELRFDAVDRRFEAIELRFDAVDRRFDRLEDKVSRQFVWTVGIQITVLLAVIGALLSGRA